MSGADSTERFSDRVEAYLAGRPRYPHEVVAHLERIGALPALPNRGVIADDRRGHAASRPNRFWRPAIA